MAVIKVQHPLGSRSCSVQLSGKRPEKDYEWDHVSEMNGTDIADCFFTVELAVRPYSQIQLNTASAKVKRKEKKATQGQLKFGPGAHNDVAECKSAPGVLELKFKDVPHDHHIRKMWLRVYFAEPKREPAKLLRLHMNCKLSNDHPAGNGYQLQTTDMMEARKRLEDHYRANGGRR